ncbi:hypothetical protein BD311DRAFT_227560 [Dichomitus squalens]|uniref:Uncharacterized protein n=1 Tax=Dichomitus squalens TaxID=114155 RepID=A0A4Q9M3W4_9APHY|nr:hypothetical protein BD311DRAFT_227560 [Dichomitus squalens]
MAETGIHPCPTMPGSIRRSPSIADTVHRTPPECDAVHRKPPTLPVPSILLGEPHPAKIPAKLTA